MNHPETNTTGLIRVGKGFASLLLLGAVACFSINISAFANAKAEKLVADAQTRFDKADYRGAVIQAKNALQEDPKNLPARILLGDSLLNSGEFATAEIALMDALNSGADKADIILQLAQSVVAQGKQKQFLSRPEFLAAGLPGPIQQKLQLMRATAMSDLGDLTGALKTIQDARPLNPNLADSWLAEASVRLRLGQVGLANEAADKAIAIAPNSADAFYVKGSVFHSAGNVGKAVTAYTSAIEKNSNHVSALVARAGLLIDTNRLGEASKDLAQVQKIAPDEPLSIYLRALLAERENKPKAAQLALRSLTEILDRIPIDFVRYKPQILMLNGLAHYGLNEPEKAKQYFEIYQKTQGDAPIAKPLAQIYLKARNYDRAIEVLETYLKARPTDVQATALLGSALMGKGQYARATLLMERAIQAKDDPALHTVLGMSLMSGGKTDQAISELEKALKSEPGQIMASTTLITLYQRTGQLKKAVALAESLARKQPDHAGYLNLLGSVKANSGDIPGARLAFEKAFKLDPGFLLPSMNVAKLDIQANKLNDADARLKQILTAQPKNTQAMFELANLENRRGNLASARSWLEKALANAGPRETQAGLALVDLHLAQGNPVPALSVAKAMSAKASDDLPVVLALAKAQIALGDITNAKSTLINATKEADYNTDAQVKVAALQMAIGNWGGAQYSLEKALANQPNDVAGLVQKTRLAIKQSEFEKATLQARAMIAKFPKNAVGQTLLGEVAIATGQNGAAEEAFRKAHQLRPSTVTYLTLFQALENIRQPTPAISLSKTWLSQHPDDVTAWLALANFYARTSNLGNARLAYEEVVRRSPYHSEALNNLANVLLLQNENGSALHVAERAALQNGLNPLIIDTLGWAQLAAGQKEKAVATLREAVKLAPKYADAHYHLGAALVQIGKIAEAKAALTTALESTPRMAEFDKAQALLKSLN